MVLALYAKTMIHFQISLKNICSSSPFQFFLIVEQELLHFLFER